MENFQCKPKCQGPLQLLSPTFFMTSSTKYAARRKGGWSDVTRQQLYSTRYTKHTQRRYHVVGANFLYIDRCNAVHGHRHDEYEDLYAGHPDGKVRTTPTTAYHHTYTLHTINVVAAASSTTCAVQNIRQTWSYSCHTR